jgi:hypothetical protein
MGAALTGAQAGEVVAAVRAVGALF